MLGPMHMGWRRVLFANWPVDPAVVAPLVPDAMRLDTYDGRAWLSVVALSAVDVRPTWLPRGVGLRLPSVNLRTYVVCDDRPGVYFLSLDADGVLGVVGARLLHHLPYFYARVEVAVDDGVVRFSSRRRHPGARPARFRATYGPTGDPLAVGPDSLVAFLLERYRTFTESPDGTLRYEAVDHAPWPAYRAAVDVDENTVFRASGVASPDTAPRYFYSPGVGAVAAPSRRLGRAARP